MTKQELMNSIDGIFAECAELMDSKNHDYATNEDALANLRLFGFLGVAVRLSDKIMRLINFAKGGNLAVESEKIEDTLKDIINYSAIAMVMLDEKEDGHVGS